MIATANGRAAILGNPATKPSSIVIDVANIPAELKELDRWLCWKWEWDQSKNDGAGKWDKPPMNAFGGPGTPSLQLMWPTLIPIPRMSADYSLHIDGKTCAKSAPVQTAYRCRNDC